MGFSRSQNVSFSSLRDNIKRIYKVAEKARKTPQTPMAAGFLLFRKKNMKQYKNTRKKAYR